MRQQSIADMIRPAAKRWAETASLEELAACLPAKIFFKIEVGHAAAPASQSGNPQPSRPTRRKRRRRLNKRARRTITERLADVKYGTPEYRKVRDQLVTELGVTARQVSSFARQARPASARRRKKR